MTTATACTTLDLDAIATALSSNLRRPVRVCRDAIGLVAGATDLDPDEYWTDMSDAHWMDLYRPTTIAGFVGILSAEFHAGEWLTLDE